MWHIGPLSCAYQCTDCTALTQCSHSHDQCLLQCILTHDWVFLYLEMFWSWLQLYMFSLMSNTSEVLTSHPQPVAAYCKGDKVSSQTSQQILLFFWRSDKKKTNVCNLFCPIIQLNLWSYRTQTYSVIIKTTRSLYRDCGRRVRETEVYCGDDSLRFSLIHMAHNTSPADSLLLEIIVSQTRAQGPMKRPQGLSWSLKQHF